MQSDGSFMGFLIAIAVVVVLIATMPFWMPWQAVGAEQVAPIPATQSCALWAQRQHTPPTYPNE